MTVALLDKIKAADNLPSPPLVAMRVLELMQSDDVSAADLAGVIQQDPALTGRILKVANSPLFGQAGRIGSLQQATVVLGMRTVKVMVLSFSLVDTVSNTHLAGFDYAGFWRRSLTTAVAARLIAAEIRKPLADTAFVSGLLCDIGVLAAIQCAPNDYTPVLDLYALGKTPLQSIEREMFSATHEAISADLLSHWRLPRSLCEAVGIHHTPSQGIHSGTSAQQLLNAVVRSAAVMGDAFCELPQTGRIEYAKKSVQDELKLDNTILDRILTELDEHVRATASVFSLDIGKTKTYQQLQAEAVAQLAKLSMTTELERAEIAQREAKAQQRVNELHNRNAHLERKANTDALTGVANRSAFDAQLADTCKTAASRNEPIGLLMLDIDRFKKLNDTFGHQVGDEALRQVGQCLKAIENDVTFVSRYGGEEFALLTANTTDQALRELAEEIREMIQQLRIPHEQRYLTLTASLGGAHVASPDAPINPGKLVQQTDQCLYHAKQSGRNRVIVRPFEAES
jgi:diguanylate cyclase (GGDEF)-like protein